MASPISKSFWQALSLGTLAGMRSMSAPAITSYLLKRQQPSSGNTPLKYIRSDAAAVTLTVIAASELVADKLPGTPNRTIPLSLGVRCLCGAIAGASVYKATGHNGYIGGLLGCGAAAASTFAFFYLRRSAVKAAKLPDTFAGIIEDSLVIGGGAALIATA